MPDVRGGLLARQANLAAYPQGAELRSYSPTLRERLLAGLLGETKPSPERRRVSEGLIGTARSPGIVDVTPAGIPMAVQEAARRRDPEGVALAILPVPGARGAKGLIPKKGTVLTNLRNLSVEEAVALAEKEPHLVAKKGGGYVGGPPGVKTRKDLLLMRRRFDKMVAEDPRGGDWYDRYRAGTSEITGGDPRDATWVSQQQGIFSQGRDPGAEVQSSLKENIGSLMGTPERAFYERQHQKHLLAIRENDPSLYTAGMPKVGEYAVKVDPGTTFATATGTNDFRHANNFGYRVGSGTTKTALSPAEHQFVDYETALAVKRARDKELGGIKDWTGESVQAAPWVVDKTNSIVRNRNYITKYMKQGFNRREATRRAYEEAAVEANKTPADFFNKHTAFATHEQIPGESTGHHPGSLFATPEERAQYDPRMLWAGPDQRDVIYSGLRLGDTGVAGRVRPSQPATGMFEGKSNAVEVGRPLIAFEKGKPGVIRKPSRRMLEAGETLRAAMDVQDVGAAHTVSAMGPVGGRRSLFIPLNRKLTEPEIHILQATGKKYGLPEISDTGQGVTVTKFGGEPKFNKGLLADVEKALPSEALAGDPFRARVDSVYEPLADRWRKGEGSESVTRYVLKKLSVTKQMRAAFDNNPFLAQKALDRIAVSKDWRAKWGIGRKDVEKFRRIIAAGPGWMGRMQKVLKNQPGTLPALAVGVLVGVNDISANEQ